MTVRSDAVPQRSNRRSDIQGLRGLAVLLVVIFHASSLLSGGFIGVDMFFAISGFVICRLLTNEMAANGRIDLGSFYLRRFRRLLPALAFMVTVVLIVSFLVVPFSLQTLVARTGLSTALFSGNTYLFLNGNLGYFALDAARNPLLHTWSLSVEEQFYFIFPVLLAAIGCPSRTSPRRRTKLLVAGLGMVAVPSFLLSWVLTNPPSSRFASHVEFAFYSSPTRAWEFAVGSLLALWRVDYLRLRSSRLARLCTGFVGASGALLVFFAAVLYSNETVFPGPSALVPVVGTCCLIYAGGEHHGIWGRLLANRVLVSLGNVSYSWYLWHWPFIVFGRALFPGTTWVAVPSAILSLGPAWFSLKMIENPIRFAVAPTKRRTRRVVGFGVGVPVLAAVVLSGVVRTSAITRIDVDRDRDLALADATRCDFRTADDLETERRCTSDLGESRVRVFLVGDSNANQFGEVFKAVAGSHGYDSSVRTMWGCPFLDAKLIKAKHEVHEDCRRFVDATLAEIASQHPSTVVIAQSVDRWLSHSEFGLQDPSGTVFVKKDAKKEAWLSAQKRLTEELHRWGIRVVLVQPIPRFGFWDPRLCLPLVTMLSPNRCVAVRTTEKMGKDRIEWRQFFEQMRSPGVQVIDFFETLCPEETCSTKRNGRWIWRDGQHLTDFGSRLLETDFASMLAR